MLLADDIHVQLVNVTVVKPLPKEDMIENIKKYSYVFTVEEHNIYGGLGSIVAEVVAYNGLSAKVCPIGIEDVFAAGYGKHAEVRAANGLDAESIYKKIKEKLQNE